MTGFDWYLPLIWALIVAGLALSGHYLWTFRPSRAWRLRALDSSGWVWVIFLLFLSAASRNALAYERPPSIEVAITNVLFGVVIDGLLVVRVVNWRRIRREHRKETNAPESTQQS